MLCWNLQNDAITPGQWLIGRVDPGPCGLSPRGDLLVYEARKGERMFTAICRPPYFTALAYWQYESPWTGGGFFPDDSTVVLGLRFGGPPEGEPVPKGFEVTDAGSYFARAARASERLADRVAEVPEANHGWTRAEPGIFHKPNPRRSRMRLERTRVGRFERRYVVVDGPRSSVVDPPTYELGVIDWADWSPDGALVFGVGGELYRQVMPRSLAGPAESPRLVADLTEQSFEHIVAPDEMRRWPMTVGPRPRPRRGR